MLGSLEREAVAVLKEKREGTTRDVLEGLHDRGRKVAYTTVSTILTRLHTKGIIERRTESFKGGDRYIYRYRDIEGRYIEHLLDGLVTTFGARSVVHLAERLDRLSERDLQSLRRRLRT